MRDLYLDLSGSVKLPNLLELIKDGGCFFIGASVTAQKNGWPDKLIELLSDKHNCCITARKKAMGGVGTLFAVTDWKNFPVPANSLTFIEFSTGDLNLGLTPLDQLESLLTLLISQVFARNSFPIVVHNWRSDYRGDKGDLVRDIYNSVCTKFSIPAIRNELFIESEISRNASLEKLWFRDICHTHPEGALKYAEHVSDAVAFISSLDSTSLRQSIDVRNLTECRRKIEAIYDIEPFLNGEQYKRKTYTYAHTGQQFAYIDCDSSVTLKASISGLLMGVAFISGPTSGWIELLIDGEVKRKFRCFDRHSYYERFILLPSVFHLHNRFIEIRVSKDPVDFSIAKKSHAQFEADRRLQVVSLVGTDLKLTESS